MPPTPITVGHPVDVSSGVVYTAWHDFQFRTRVPLIWRRFYSTANLAPTALGRGWTSSFFSEIQEAGDEIIFRGEEGHEFRLAKPTEAQPSSEFYHQLEVRSEDGGYVARSWHRHQSLHFKTRTGPSAFSLSRIEDLSGNALVLSYDEEGRLKGISPSSASKTVLFHYGDGGLIGRIELLIPGYAPETLVTYDHDAQGHLVRATDSSGHHFVYEYNSAHQLVREQNKLGGCFHFEYDGSGRCTRTWGDGGYLERVLVYDAEKRMTRVKNSAGAESVYFFNPSGELERKIDSLGRVTTAKSVFGLSQRIAANGARTTKEYDERARLVKLTNGRGDSFTYEYEAHDQVSVVTDPAGTRWPKKYDARGRLIEFTDGNGGVWALTRGEGGEIVKQTDPCGRELVRRYERGLRWQELSDSLGYLRFECDPKGRPVLLSDAEGVVETLETDTQGLITHRRLPDGTESVYRYDAAGNLTHVRYYNGAVWTFDYDRYSRLLAIAKPCGGVINLAYDAEGHRVTLRNERGEEMRDAYDTEGQLIARIHFDGRVERFKYDGAGHIAEVVRSDGSRVFWEYDGVGNLIEERITAPSGEGDQEYLAHYEYDWRGNLTRAQDTTTEVAFVFDAAGRLVEERQAGGIVSYRYDGAGKLVGRELADGAVGEIRFEYDALGMLAAVSDRQGKVEGFTYDATGRLSQRSLRGGLTERFAYDERRRLSEQEVSQAGTTLINRKYRYGEADTLTELKDSARGTFRWEYDAELRLTRADAPGQHERFEYAAGDDLVRLNGSLLTYEPGSRLTGASGAELEYDGRGNLTGVTREGRKVRYGYDLKNRLTKVISPDGSVVQFAYDALGRRIAKESGAGKTHFVWSNRVLAAIRPSVGEPIEVLESSATRRPLVRWRGEGVEHFICNGLGTPQEVVTPSQEVVWSGTYFAYGKCRSRQSADAGLQALRSPGQYEDEETGLHYNSQRYYDPLLGRYLTPDPIGIDGGLNLYDYPRDPVNCYDPFGLSCPNPQLIDTDPHGRWEIYQHDDGQLTIRADCTRAFANRPPGSDPMLRPTIHAGQDNEINLPEAHLGEGGRVIVMEGTHRSAAASRGAQMPQDPDHPHLGGVPGRPGWMEYEYSPDFDDPDQLGTPLQDLQYPASYPHKLPP